MSWSTSTTIRAPAEAGTEAPPTGPAVPTATNAVGSNRPLPPTPAGAEADTTVLRAGNDKSATAICIMADIAKMTPHELLVSIVALKAMKEMPRVVFLSAALPNPYLFLMNILLTAEYVPQIEYDLFAEVLGLENSHVAALEVHAVLEKVKHWPFSFPPPGITLHVPPPRATVNFPPPNTSVKFGRFTAKKVWREDHSS